IKDLLAYLRVLANPADDASLERIINTPARGIGEQTVGAVRTAARDAGIAMAELLQRSGPVPGLAASSAARVRTFAELMRELAGELAGDSLATLLERVLELTAYRDRLEEAGADRASRVENIDELIAVARDFDERSPPDEDTRARLQRF